MLHVGKKVAKGSLTPNFFFVFIVCDNRNDQMKIKIIKNGIEYLSRLSMVVVVLVTLIFAIHVFLFYFWILVCQRDLRYVIQTYTF